MRDFFLRDLLPKDVRDALWQYFLDHSKIQKNGYWGIMFYTRNEDDFWRRVQARFSGDFIRYNAEEKNVRQRAKFDALMYQKEESRHWEKRVAKIKAGNRILDKIYFWLYEKSKKYIDKIDINGQ